MAQDIKSLVKQMTLEKKAGMCSGSDWWYVQAVERLGSPAVMFSDGPHGLRKQEPGLKGSIKAVCFPAACATASSFDRELLRALGEALGDECQAEDISVLLGPTVNIKRSPLCGRNFEYFSEDPLLAGELAASYIDWVVNKNTEPGDLLNDPRTRGILGSIAAEYAKTAGDAKAQNFLEWMQTQTGSMPLRTLRSLRGLPEKQIDTFINMFNQAIKE
jgi:hypothetical protein